VVVRSVQRDLVARRVGDQLAEVLGAQGEVREELEAEYRSDPIAIGFNPKYVVELLAQMSSDQVTRDGALVTAVRLL
jgi:hypothetical protein